MDGSPSSIILERSGGGEEREGEGGKEEKERVCLRERGRNKEHQTCGNWIPTELSRVEYKFDFDLYYRTPHLSASFSRFLFPTNKN